MPVNSPAYVHVSRHCCGRHALWPTWYYRLSKPAGTYTVSDCRKALHKKMSNHFFLADCSMRRWLCRSN